MRSAVLLIVVVVLAACASSERPPTFAHGGELSYPQEAKDRGIEGTVIVRYDVTAKGVVQNVAIVTAQPAGVFDDTALRYVATWRFNPATDDGRPIAAPNRTSEIHFTLVDKDPYTGL